jgi:hypothetical protein
MLTRSKSKPKTKNEEVKNISYQNDEIVDNQPICNNNSTAVEEATAKLNERLTNSFKSIIVNYHLKVTYFNYIFLSIHSYALRCFTYAFCIFGYAL